MSDPNHTAPPANNAELVKRLRGCGETLRPLVEQVEDRMAGAGLNEKSQIYAHDFEPLISVPPLLIEAADALSRPAAPVAKEAEKQGILDAMLETLRLMVKGEDAPNSDQALSYAHCAGMYTRASEERFSDDKLNRWLGWMQAAAVASGAATLEQMKEISRRIASAPRAPGKSAREVAEGVVRDAALMLANRSPSDPTFKDNLVALIAAALEAGQPKAETWQPIESAPRDGTKQLIVGHCDKQWIRFGRWYPQEGAWYYSGTSERSQWSQVRGDAPTHWMPLPPAPASEVGEVR